ncbi:M3 family metallopeptidase [Pseudoxanthomonas sp. CAU 1598]|uniref:M3 family metallopeptidase n=2 Tax=Pseudomarimonas arenosa TaxID=2774145 RepID=A0AAW3ZIL4_9GAMM|nr:M3 family metallopeptidase [Pseudomarimonas arenosa]
MKQALMAAALGLALSLPFGAAQATNAADNPFYTVSELPFQMPPFDKIKDEHYVPALTRGMAEHRAEIEAIANSKDAPSFENTIVALDKSGALLTRVSNVFFNLSGANTNDELQKIQRDFAPQFAAHQDAIVLNEALFKRVETIYQARQKLGLNDEDQRLIVRNYTDFVRAGAKLQGEQREQLKTLNARLAELQTQFSQNVLNETNARGLSVSDKAELAGLSEEAITAAETAAKAKGSEAPYLIALMNTSGQPALASLENREVRQRLFEASILRSSSGGEHDNRQLAIEMAKLRAQRANLLGYPTHAAYMLEDQTARSVDTVNKMMRELAPAAVANARREAAEMQAMIKADGKDFELAGWDWAYYANKLRQKKYNFDASELRPYFELNNVLEKGVFYAAGQLYGLQFERRTDLPVYQEDVQVYQVNEADGTPLGLFIADFYARANKRGGAWMNEYVSQSKLLGTQPVIGNHLNIPKPAAGQPTLMTFDEVTTLFHEFGHALHGLFSDVRYPRFAGTNVPTDFVEYPSQVNEMWATWPSVLANYAKHYKTGEQIPQELLDKVLAAEQFGQGFATTEYLAAALLDQAWHQLSADQVPTDALAFEAKTLQDLGLDFAPVPPRYRSTYFSHIFAGGYSAGYYSYLWSEVLDADSVEWFKENGGLKRANGDHFRKTLLSRGGSEEALELFNQFRGRAPDIAPLLQRRGLASGATAH